MFSVYRIKERPQTKEWLGDFETFDEADQCIRDDIDRMAVDAGLEDEDIDYFKLHSFYGDWHYIIEEG